MVIKKRIESREKKHITQLGVNQHFGEVSFIFGSPAIAKVKSTKYSLLGVINNVQKKVLKKEFPALFNTIKSEVLKYSSPWMEQILEILPQLTYFRNLNLYDLNNVAHHFVLLQYNKGSKLFEQGQMNRGLFIIMKGFVLLRFKTKSADTPLQICEKGTVLNNDHFGHSQKPLETEAIASSLTTCAYLSV